MRYSDPGAGHLSEYKILTSLLNYVTQESWEIFLYREIFHPLYMEDTSLKINPQANYRATESAKQQVPLTQNSSLKRN